MCTGAVVRGKHKLKPVNNAWSQNGDKAYMAMKMFGLKIKGWESAVV